MKKSVVFSLCTVFALILNVGTLRAQGREVDESKWITITLKPDTKRIKLDFNEPSVWIEVTGVKDQVVQAASNTYYYTPEGTEIKVFGAITYISAYAIGAVALDVSTNPGLEKIQWESDEISTLNLEKNVKLKSLTISGNKLTSLDLKNNTELEELHCDNNALPSLNLQSATKLKLLNCNNNKLQSLDLHANTALKALSCHTNEFTSLDLSANSELEELNCSNNKIEKLDLQNLTKLKILRASKNALTSLDLKASKALEELFCGDNSLTEVDVTECTKLEKLLVGFNDLSVLDVTKNTKLKQLDIYSNNLTDLDLKANTALEYVSVGYNYLSSLDLSEKPNLHTVYCFHNNLSASTLNAIYCQLPDRTRASEPGKIHVAFSADYTNEVLIARASSKAITDAKNWKIVYNASTTEIPEITGTQTCGTPAKLTVTPEKSLAKVSCIGAEGTLNITSSGKWRLDKTTLPVDVEVSPSEGNSGENVTVKIAPNENSDGKYIALAFFLEEDPAVRDVIVLNQLWASIEVTPEGDYTFPAAGETKTEYLTVVSPGEWQVTSSNQEWFPVETQSGAMGTTKVTIKANTNPNTEMRSAEMRFVLKKDDEVRYTLLLKQEGSAEKSIVVSPNETLSLDAAGEKKEDYFTIESPSAWKLAKNAEWLKVNKTEGVSGDKLTIEALVNPNTEERSAELTFTLTDEPSVKKAITVKQHGTPAAVESVMFTGITVAPNPFTTQLRIKNEAQIVGRYVLVTISGTVIRTGVLEGAEIVIHTADLSAGAYLLRLLVGKETKMLRVVKE
ncbi:MAG: BACON domain-containing protein [Bacteroides sp.]